MVVVGGAPLGVSVSPTEEEKESEAGVSRLGVELPPPHTPTL